MIKDNTKISFSNALENLLLAMPFSKITVTNICNACGATRQTFYYHFKDKYDLVAWIYMKDCEEASKQTQMTTDNYLSKERLTNMNRILKSKPFYKQVFKDNSQNCLSHYIGVHFMNAAEESIKKYLNISKLDYKLYCSISFYCLACIDYALYWIKSDSALSPEFIADIQIQNMPEILKKSVVQMND